MSLSFITHFIIHWFFYSSVALRASFCRFRFSFSLSHCLRSSFCIPLSDTSCPSKYFGCQFLYVAFLLGSVVRPSVRLYRLRRSLSLSLFSLLLARTHTHINALFLSSALSLSLSLSLNLSLSLFPAPFLSPLFFPQYPSLPAWHLYAFWMIAWSSCPCLPKTPVPLPHGIRSNRLS